MLDQSFNIPVFWAPIVGLVLTMMCICGRSSAVWQRFGLSRAQEGSH